MIFSGQENANIHVVAVLERPLFSKWMHLPILNIDVAVARDLLPSNYNLHLPPHTSTNLPQSYRIGLINRAVRQWSRVKQ